MSIRTNRYLVNCKSKGGLEEYDGNYILAGLQRAYIVRSYSKVSANKIMITFMDDMSDSFAHEVGIMMNSGRPNDMFLMTNDSAFTWEIACCGVDFVEKISNISAAVHFRKIEYAHE